MSGSQLATAYNDALVDSLPVRRGGDYMLYSPLILAIERCLN